MSCSCRNKYNGLIIPSQNVLKVNQKFNTTKKLSNDTKFNTLTLILILGLLQPYFCHKELKSLCKLIK